MAGIKVYVSDATEQKFRKASMQVFGYHRGSLSSAAEQAFEVWSKNILETDKSPAIPKDPVAAIKGLLAKTRFTSVELQHKASEWRAEKALSKTRK